MALSFTLQDRMKTSKNWTLATDLDCFGWHTWLRHLLTGLKESKMLKPFWEGFSVADDRENLCHWFFCALPWMIPSIPVEFMVSVGHTVHYSIPPEMDFYLQLCVFSKRSGQYIMLMIFSKDEALLFHCLWSFPESTEYSSLNFQTLNVLGKMCKTKQMAKVSLDVTRTQPYICLRPGELTPDSNVDHKHISLPCSPNLSRGRHSTSQNPLPWQCSRRASSVSISGLHWLEKSNLSSLRGKSHLEESILYIHNSTAGSWWASNTSSKRKKEGNRKGKGEIEERKKGKKEGGKRGWREGRGEGGRD